MPAIKASKSGVESSRRVRHVRTPELNGSELTYVQSWDGAAPPDIRPQLEVILVDSADKTIRHRGASQRIRSGMVGLRTPFESGQLVARHASETRVRVLALAEHEVEGALEGSSPLASDVPGVLAYRDGPSLRDRAREVFDLVETRAPALEIQTHLATCATEAVRVLVGVRADSLIAANLPAAERIREVLHDRMNEDLTLDDLTRAVSLSRAYVVRAFRRAFGLPPHEYLMQLRVARACTLLGEGERPTDVAHACGFYDQSHLNRWFHKVVGVTPGAYAAAHGHRVEAPRPATRSRPRS